MSRVTIQVQELVETRAGTPVLVGGYIEDIFMAEGRVVLLMVDSWIYGYYLLSDGERALSARSAPLGYLLEAALSRSRS